MRAHNCGIAIERYDPTKEIEICAISRFQVRLLCPRCSISDEDICRALILMVHVIVRRANECSVTVERYRVSEIVLSLCIRSPSAVAAT